MSSVSDNLKSVIEVAREAERAGFLTAVDPNQVHVYRDEHGYTVPLSLDHFRERPIRIEAQPRFYDVPSFVAYLDRHSGDREALTIWADRGQSQIEAILDSHTPGGPSWQRHRAYLFLKRSSEWLTWTGEDGVMVSQQEFAEFLEDNLADIVDPPAAQLLEVVTTLSATTKVEFKSGVRLDNGQIKVQYEETMSARAGQKGNLEIPYSFSLGIRVYQAGDPYRVNARLRYRIEHGALRLGFVLERTDDVMEAAFNETVLKLREALDGHPVYLGASR